MFVKIFEVKSLFLVAANVRILIQESVRKFHVYLSANANNVTPTCALLAANPPDLITDFVICHAFKPSLLANVANFQIGPHNFKIGIKIFSCLTVSLIHIFKHTYTLTSFSLLLSFLFLVLLGTVNSFILGWLNFCSCTSTTITLINVAVWLV